jgi:hypothetical protein
MLSIIIAAIIPRSIIRHIRVISGRTSTDLKVKGLCEGIWPKDQNDQKASPFTRSAHANKFFHAVKGKYTNMSLRFATPTEVRFVLGLILQYRNLDWQNEPGEP